MYDNHQELKIATMTKEPNDNHIKVENHFKLRKISLENAFKKHNPLLKSTRPTIVITKDESASEDEHNQSKGSSKERDIIFKRCFPTALLRSRFHNNTSSIDNRVNTAGSS